MINLTSKGKKLLFFALFLLVPFFMISLHAQNINFKYKVDSLKVGELYQYSISVTVTAGEGPFMIGVYENLKEDLRELDKKENVVSNEAKLTFIGRKSCIIYVRNTSQSAIKTLIYN